MKDQRLTIENLKAALGELGATSEDVHLYFNQLLMLQVGEICLRLGIGAEQKHVVYGEWHEANWAVECDGKRLEFDGMEAINVNER